MVVELENTTVCYPAVHGSDRIDALRAVDLGIYPGEFTAVIGPSGAGKTTLFRTISGFMRPTAGRVTVDGMDLARISSSSQRQLRRRIAIVHQEYNLVARASAAHNVLLGRLGYVNPFASLFGHFPREDRRKAYAALARFDMAERANHRVDQLSGGERQRVALARALVQQPAIMLADEPAANLDVALSEMLLELLSSLNREDGLTVVLNLHDVELATRFANRIVALRAGRMVFDGPPGMLDRARMEAIYGPTAGKGVRQAA